MINTSSLVGIVHLGVNHKTDKKSNIVMAPSTCKNAHSFAGSINSKPSSLPIVMFFLGSDNRMGNDSRWIKWINSGWQIIDNLHRFNCFSGSKVFLSFIGMIIRNSKSLVAITAPCPDTVGASKNGKWWLRISRKPDPFLPPLQAPSSATKKPDSLLNPSLFRFVED